MFMHLLMAILITFYGDLFNYSKKFDEDYIGFGENDIYKDPPNH